MFYLLCLVRGNEDDGIQIIEIDDGPNKGMTNGRNSGDFRGKLPISDSTLRKRNLEISLCGTDSDNDSGDSTRGQLLKRQRINLV